MSVQTAVSVLLAALVLIPGVLSQNWGVWYNPGSICALQGSTVVMGCTYSYPRDNTVTQTFWFIEKPVYPTEPTDLSAVPQYVNRTEYLGNKVNNCTLRLRNLTTSDSTTYWFRFITNTAGGKWTGQPGVSLSVTEFQYLLYATKSTSVSISPSGAIAEGSSVTLTCSSTANPRVKNYTWFKTSGAGVWKMESGQSLTIAEVSSADSGQYYCEAQNNMGACRSAAVTLVVSRGCTLLTALVAAVGSVVVLLLAVLIILLIRRRVTAPPTQDSSTGGAQTEGEKSDPLSNTALDLRAMSSDNNTLRVSGSRRAHRTATTTLLSRVQLSPQYMRISGHQRREEGTDTAGDET